MRDRQSKAKKTAQIVDKGWRCRIGLCISQGFNAPFEEYTERTEKSKDDPGMWDVLEKKGLENGGEGKTWASRKGVVLKRRGSPRRSAR